VTAPEFAFLVMGLVLGIAAGAALLEIVRARPAAPREVRVTVAQDAIPRRSATLADPAFGRVSPEPARGGPADRRDMPAEPPVGTAERRTSVQSTGPLTLALMGTAAGRPVSAPGQASGQMAPPDRVGVPVSRGDDPLLAAMRASAAASAVAAMRTTTATAVEERPRILSGPDPILVSMAEDGAPPADAPAQAAGAAGASGSASDPSVAPSGPCAEQRHLADERCALATRARDQARAADETHRAAQRSYDDHEARAGQAATAADPRAVRRAKDEAQARFRAARIGARTTDEVETAARTWLMEINEINGEARDAATVLVREQEAVRSLTLELERIAMETDAARIAAETAEAACLAAREAVAACEEAAAGIVGHHPAMPSGAPDDDEIGDQAPVAAALGSGGTPRIFRLVRGDRAAMAELVYAMAGDDPSGRKRWQLAMSDLVDAILADSIAAACLDFPSDHPFWGPFPTEQGRDIVQALSSLGYRFDGLGGWVDGRVPSQRDLSLALGYAGVDPMRIRPWPSDAEVAELLRDVVVAADERLAGAAGDLTLGELVTMLGRRADGLAEVWNEWGRLRPLLLEEH
jgi:hypothetical protein